MDQTNQRDSSLGSPGKRAAAFSVHMFTALGAGIALIALLEAVREHWAAMFGWLGAALIVDALDGPIARRLDVARLQPNVLADGNISSLTTDRLPFTADHFPKSLCEEWLARPGAHFFYYDDRYYWHDGAGRMRQHCAELGVTMVLNEVKPAPPIAQRRPSAV